jgi:cell division septation protein DedD
MQWSMPHRVLQVVAGVIVFIALAAFTLGVVNAPQRGRLPGERADGGSGATAAPLAATEATPLSQERIEGPPPPPELTAEQKARQDADKEAKAEADAARAPASAAPPATAAEPVTPTPTLQAPEPAAAPPDEAPH